MGPSAVLAATSTVTGPVAAPAGTIATICVSLQLLTVAATPSNVTTLSLWLGPNPAPAIVTVEPMEPADGDMPVIESASITVNETPGPGKPLTVTFTGPFVAFVGTFTEMLVSLQRRACATTPLESPST